MSKITSECIAAIDTPFEELVARLAKETKLDLTSMTLPAMLVALKNYDPNTVAPNAG